MIVFEPITLSWKGQEHEIKVNFALINRIESKVSLANLLTRVQSGDVPLSHLASLFAEMLKSVGVSTTAEQVYLEMYGGGDTDQQAVIQASIAALTACFPQNADTGGEGKPKRGKQKK